MKVRQPARATARVATAPGGAGARVLFFVSDCPRVRVGVGACRVAVGAREMCGTTAQRNVALCLPKGWGCLTVLLLTIDI